MSTKYIPALPGTEALFATRNGSGKKVIVRRTVVAWDISGAFSHPYPVTLVEQDALPTLDDIALQVAIAILFPDGHLESLDGARRWPTIEAFRRSEFGDSHTKEVA
jgi:hypothetical protein